MTTPNEEKSRIDELVLASRVFEQCRLKFGEAGDGGIDDALQSLAYDLGRGHAVRAPNWDRFKAAIVNQILTTKYLDRCQLCANNREALKVEEIDEKEIRGAVERELDLIVKDAIRHVSRIQIWQL